MGVMLEASEVSFRVPGRTLVDEVSLTIPPGKVTTLLGPNGAGKSTLLKLLCRQQAPSAGKIMLAGRPLEGWNLRELARRRAVLPQASAVPFDFTAREIVAMGRAPHGDGSRCEAMVRRAMEMTECIRFEDRIVRTLSGGEMQRVNLARVLVQLGLGETQEPSLLLLDEPVSSQDPAHQHGALQLSRELARKGLAVFVILHDLNLAAQYSDGIVILKDGRIVANGAPQEVLQPATITEVFHVEATLGHNPITGGPAVFVEPLRNGDAPLR